MKISIQPILKVLPNKFIDNLYSDDFSVLQTECTFDEM